MNTLAHMYACRCAVCSLHCLQGDASPESVAKFQLFEVSQTVLSLSPPVISEAVVTSNLLIHVTTGVPCVHVMEQKVLDA